MSLSKDISESIKKNLPEYVGKELQEFINRADQINSCNAKQELKQAQKDAKRRDETIKRLDDQIKQAEEIIDETEKALLAARSVIEENQKAVDAAVNLRHETDLKTAELKQLNAEEKVNLVTSMFAQVFKAPTVREEIQKTVPLTNSGTTTQYQNGQPVQAPYTSTQLVDGKETKTTTNE